MQEKFCQGLLGCVGGAPIDAGTLQAFYYFGYPIMLVQFDAQSPTVSNAGFSQRMIIKPLDFLYSAYCWIINTQVNAQTPNKQGAGLIADVCALITTTCALFAHDTQTNQSSNMIGSFYSVYSLNTVHWHLHTTIVGDMGLLP